MSEMIEDVVKRLRDRAEARRRSGKLLQIDDRMFDLIADEIEEAAKALKADRDNWRDQAFAEASRANAAISKESLQVGNAEKIIAALYEIRLVCWKAGVTMGYDVACGIIKAKSRVALNAKPRNCDRQYQNAYDVLKCFTDETGRQIFNTSDVIDWLLFTEAKGGEK